MPVLKWEKVETTEKTERASCEGFRFYVQPACSSDMTILGVICDFDLGHGAPCYQTIGWYHRPAKAREVAQFIADVATHKLGKVTQI